MKKALWAAALAAPLLAHADLVVNGSFEADPQAAGTWGVYHNLTGWKGANNIELRNAFDGSAQHGVNFVELDTTANKQMFQNLSGAPGTYLLSFWYSARPGVGAGSNDLQVLFDDSLLAELLVDEAGGNTHYWHHFQTLVAFDGDAQLRFRARGVSDSYGGSIDNVSLTAAVPEPSGLALTLAALAGLGLAMRRRRT